MSSLLIAALAMSFSSPATAQPHHFLYAPDIHGNRIAFSAEGDIWLSNLKTHETRRLTSDPGLETYPKFSPDGKELAFEGSYGGKIDIYVMPTEGGIPHRVTYDPTIARLLGWTPDGKGLLFRSNRSTALEPPQLFTIPWRGGPVKRLPVPQAFFGELSPNGKELAYVPDSNEWMNWFRYQAGEADSIWLTDLTGKHFTELTHNKWVNTTPVWVGNKIYFVSEQSGVRNLWELNPKTDAEKQLTFSTTVPVRYPSSDGRKVIYQIGPTLGVYDPQTNKSEVLSIPLHSDRLHARPVDVPIAAAIESSAIGPTGKRVAIIARGQIVTVPAKHGQMNLLEDDATQRSRNAAWSPDGKQIAFTSDKTGEEQLYVVGDQPGDKIRQVTTNLNGENFRPVWSPNEKYIVIGDRQLRIQLVNVATGKITLIDQADRGGSYDQPNQDYTFSPDSKWVAFSKIGFGWNNSVWLYNIKTGQKTEISDPEISSASPTFSPDGKYLYMIQQRIAHMVGSAFNSQLAYTKPTVITAVSLMPTTKSPFLAKDEEEGVPSKPKPSPKPPTVKPANVKKAPSIKIDLNGIQNRLVDVGLPPSNYSQVVAIAGGKLLVSNSAPSTNPGPPATTLASYDVKTKKSTLLAPMILPLGNADDPLLFQVSGSGANVLVHSPAGLQVLSTVAPTPPQTVALAGLIIRINTEQEWKQELNESWRVARDFYIDPGMGGVNWLAVKAKYNAMLPMVADRTDLTHIIGDMLAELSTGHCYTFGPNPYVKMGPPLGFLGANISNDPIAKAWKIDRILNAGRWNFQFESPLSAPGLNVKAGDYLLDINGLPLQTNCDFEKNLVGTAGHVIALTISPSANGVGKRVIHIVPMSSDRHLRYLDWVEGRKEYVAKRTNNQIAYVHLSDMENNGADEFAQMYYANVEKPGIIMDVRGNGGGYISYNILEPLATKTLGFGQPRYGLGWRRESWGPLGHIVGICNEWDFSDGEQFSEDFKLLHIGPLVGHRTGGGEIGSGNGYPLADGGEVYVPDYGSWVIKKHKWIVEGRGVEPNYPVNQNQAKVMAGDDPQLDEAIQLELDYLKAHPFSIPKPPPFPNHTGGSRSEKGVAKH